MKKTEGHPLVTFRLQACRPYVGIIQIRFPGRRSYLPLSLSGPWTSSSPSLILSHSTPRAARCQSLFPHIFRFSLSPEYTANPVPVVFAGKLGVLSGKCLLCSHRCLKNSQPEKREPPRPRVCAAGAAKAFPLFFTSPPACGPAPCSCPWRRHRERRCR